MPEPDTVQEPSVQSVTRKETKNAIPSELVQIRELVMEVMNSLQTKQQALQKSRDIDYSLSTAQQQLRRLSGLHSEIQKVVDAAPIEDSEALSDLQARSAQVQTQLGDLGTNWTQSDGILPNKKVLKRHLRDILLQLQSVLSDVATELASLETAEQFIGIHQEIFDSLSAAIARERQQVELGDFGRSRKSELLEQIHLLALQIYRFRQLTTEPRLRKQTARFEVIALQIQDTVNGLDIEDNNAAELLDSSTYVIERQLCQLEFNGRLQFLMLPAGWVVNRYKDITRLQSVQSRVLSGLALSLLFSGVTFSLFTLILTSASALASASQNELQDKIKKTHEAIAQEVTTLIEKEDDKKNSEARESTAQAEIIELRKQIEPIETLEGRNTANPEIETAATEAVEQAVLEQATLDQATLDKLQQEQSETQKELRKIDVERQDLLESLEKQLETLSTLTTQQPETPLSRNSNSSQIIRVLYDTAHFLNQKELLNHLRRILLAAFSGAVGSMMSILIRLEQMDKEDIKNPFLLGALKPLLGAVFGVAVFAILSTGVIDIFPASFSLSEGRSESITTTKSAEGALTRRRDPLGELDPQELYTIFLVAFIAGFSERLASDTLKSVSSKGSIG